MHRFLIFFGVFECFVGIGLASYGCAKSNDRTAFPADSGGVGTNDSGSSSSGGGGDDAGDDGGLVPPGSSGGAVSFGEGGVVVPPAPADGGIACPSGLMCNVACGDAGAATTLTGKVYDPAGKDPLYNVAVYVPATGLQPLPRGVPTGADACSCAALFKAGALAATATDVDGSFTLTNVPVGPVTLVLQVGKWRRAIKVTTSACHGNAQPDKSLTLPGTLVGAGPDDNMPDIAVSTGQADSLECLMTRIGVPAAEYVAGAATTGHVHIFSGGKGNGGNGPVAIGKPETNPMPAAPSSSAALWMTQDQLMPYDIALLSCEGGETYNANPAALESYLNAGGRAFASHFHYAFFGGPLGTMQEQKYSAPPDWGPSLATWNIDTPAGLNFMGVVGATIDTTLNGTTMAFPKGVALQKWLTGVGALGTDGVPVADVAIYQPRFNASVLPTDKPSQPWLTSDPALGDGGANADAGTTDSGGADGGASSSQAMYFSFDTPVTSEGGAGYCGRAVFSDLHVTGNPRTHDTPNAAGGMPPPAGCDTGADLSPQEKVLEFMLFDLSSCVVADTVAPPIPVPSPPR
jgi:hypothetical protein